VSGTVRIGDIARMLGLSVSRVRQLADQRVIPSWRTTGGHRVFDPAEVAILIEFGGISGGGRQRPGAPEYEGDFPIAGLAEDVVWRDIVSSIGLDVETGGVHIMEYAFEEMLNNAIDHSDGAVARVRFWSSSEALDFVVADDGVGALARLRQELGLPDDLSSIQELSKGKRTTNPAEHSGQGIFFTSKAVDRFSLSANGWRWTVDNVVGDQYVAEAPRAAGTVVACRLDPATTRTMTEVFGEFTRGSSFDVSRPRIALLAYGRRLISRSEAKLLLEGLDAFAEVELDFGGVEAVGQGFVDQVFRVWAAAHPGTRVVPIDMSPAVRFMVERGLPGVTPGRPE
jgi:hypothetical protein